VHSATTCRGIASFIRAVAKISILGTVLVAVLLRTVLRR
jgi:hypothetical protein